jgi:hypothetical protein
LSDKYDQGKPRLKAREHKQGQNTTAPCLILEKMEPYQKLEMDCKGENISLNGNPVPLSELNDPRIVSVLHEYYFLFGDLGRSIVKATRETERMQTTASERTKKAVGIIKDISCTCASMGGIPSPLSVYMVLICGPTCVGMMIADWSL